MIYLVGRSKKFYYADARYTATTNSKSDTAFSEEARRALTGMVLVIQGKAVTRVETRLVVVLVATRLQMVTKDSLSIISPDHVSL